MKALKALFLHAALEKEVAKTQKHDKGNRPFRIPPSPHNESQLMDDIVDGTEAGWAAGHIGAM